MSPLILSVDTATLGGSVAISRGKSLLASVVGDSQLSHSNSLLADINRILSKTNVELSDIDQFAVTLGPGSFTGLRIGIATVKGLAATLNRGCVGIPTLHAIAHAAGVSDATLALLPAGRGEVFAQLLSVSNDDRVIELDAAAHIPPFRLMDRYGDLPDLCLTGPWAQTHVETLLSLARQAGHQILEVNTSATGWRLAPSTPNLAPHVAALAAVRVENAELETPNMLRAIYVRPSDAEINLGHSSGRQ
jgi:tRNA threonylcarbamoyladenosine biosynthesis protein TsaB